MMKRSAELVVISVVSLACTSAPAAGQPAPAKGVEGVWQGTLKPTPQVELRITLEVTKRKDGSLTGKWGSPDQGAKELPLASISFQKNELSFSATNGAAYTGKLSASGTELVGEWKQGGGRLPLTFARFDPSKVVVVPIPKELEGLWEGRLKLPRGMELRVVLKVQKGKDSALTAALASPDQGANNIAISSINLKDDVLTFESKAIGARYTGKKNKAGTAFEGEFHQAGAKFPLTLKKTDKISAAVRPQTPKPPFPYREVAVTYDNKAAGVTLAGTLTLPAAERPVPAVLLITGSGAQDRDETILGHKPFLVLADYLTRRGVAVLRVDDRGVGGSTGSVSSSTSEDFAGDVLAGIGFLKKRPEIDPARIGLIGHSEGGIIAPIAASRSRDVAFIVLMAGTGLPGADILVSQGQLILKADGASESQLAFQRDAQKRLIGIVGTEKDETAARAKLAAASKEIVAAMPESERRALGDAGSALSEAAVNRVNTRWFRFFLTYDPRPALRKVSCPVLAINGEKDLQVEPKANLSEIEKALRAGGNQNVRTVELPSLNHLLQPCKTGSPSEYAAIETTIDPEALRTIGDWIVQKTAVK
jgi:pimeloyl-ACP methyl ester carboxylesterase